MRTLLISHAAETLGVPESKLECQYGVVVATDEPKRKSNYATIAKHANLAGKEIRVEAGFEVPRFEHPVEGSMEIPHWAFMYATALALVEVDTLTGSTKVLRFLIAPDAGKVISPQNLRGQCEGAVVQGLGYALMEDAIIQDGRIKTPNFTTYLIPTIRDAPDIEVLPVETFEKTGPFGAKGVGEIAIIPVAPAIASAVFDAVGVRSLTLPMTAERIFKSLRTNKTS
jgi:CO/xanthine dehydrogenase Mo-binding subunit